MENQVAVQTQPTPNVSLLFDIQLFEHAQRIGKMLASSTMVPEHFRGNIGNCVIALNFAHRAGIDPFLLFQKIYIIHGKPAIETQLQIALFNQGGRFSPLTYDITGSGDNRTCVAHATDINTKEDVVGPPVSIGMAKKEGWYQKKGSKWQTLPELMLRYRAAAFFIRLYAPETTLGLQTPEELSDVIDVTPAQEIAEHANAEVLDFPQPKEPESKKVEPVPEPAPADGMTEAEKQEIRDQEAAEAILTAGPGF